MPHPRSPAARTLDWASLGLPHPDSPVGRHLDWTFADLAHPDSPSRRGNLWNAGQGESSSSADGEFTGTWLAAEIKLNQHSDGLRDALPDTGLQIIYDRQISLVREAFSFMRSFPPTDPFQMLRYLQRQIVWVHCHLQSALGKSYEIAVEPILGQIDSFRAPTVFRDRAKLLAEIQTLSGSYYTKATESVQQHLRDAQKTGKEQEWIHKWRAQMLVCAAAGAVVEPAVEEPQAPARKPPKKDQAEKTWIAIQLIDDRGDPVPNAAYTVTLPDGSVMTGSLDDQGSARFDEIDPGDCIVSFPEIHAKEWKRA